MADSIGSVQFFRLDGDLETKKQTMHEISNPAIDGVAIVKDGIRAFPTQLQGLVDVDSSSDANALIATYAALVGTIVSISINGQSRSNYLVLDGKVNRRRFVTNSVGGMTAGNWLVRSVFTVMYVGV